MTSDCEDYVICLGDVHQLPNRLRPDPLHHSSIAVFSDLAYEDELIARLLYKPILSSYQALKQICYDPLINVRLIIVAVDLRNPSAVPRSFDEHINFINELKSEEKFQSTQVTILACNCTHFLDSITGYAADIMAGILRRRALKLNASLYYSEGLHDYESAMFYIIFDIRSRLVHARSNVRKPTLSDSYLIIPAGLDNDELIAKLTAPEEKFKHVFPDAMRENRQLIQRVTAIDDSDFIQLVQNDLEKFLTENDLKSPVSCRSSSNQSIMYQSPSISSTPSTPAATSQIAVKSFFESLLTARPNEDQIDHGVRQRNAQHALHDMTK